MASTPRKDNYPGPRTTTESLRLRAQHDLTRNALGGLVLCPVDLSLPNLRILDSGTADGYFLYELRSQLGHPDSADLIGTDVASYPDTIGLPPNISLRKQNILEEWPEAWTGSFDFVHQRHTMANAGSFDEAVRVAGRLVKLVKPGGWIQIVDGFAPVAPVEPDDAPSAKVFKTMGRMLERFGLDGTLGTKLPEILAAAGSLENLGSKQGTSRLGKGAQSRELEAAGYAQLRGLESAMVPALKNMPDAPMTGEELAALIPLAMEEASVEGIDMHWFAAWGQKPNM